MEASSRRIGFIGLGRMGGSIATRLLDAGHPLMICDASQAALAPFTQQGARAIRSAAALADEAEVIFACLPSTAASLEVAFGENGVIHGKSVRCYIECSTIGAPVMTQIAQSLAARAIDVVDAPVSGGPAAARAGTLTMIASGSGSAIDRVRSLLEQIAKRVIIVGDKAGLAQVCKLVNNALSLVGMALACEAVVVGVKAGLDAQTLLDAINAGTGRNSATLDKFPKAILTRSFDYGGPLSAASKDLHLFLDEARRLEVPTGVTRAGAELWDIAGAEGDPDRDYTTLIKLIERWAGIEVRGARGMCDV